MQTDPIGYDGGANLYAYVENSPVYRTDPSGHGINNCPGPDCDVPLPSPEQRAEVAEAVKNSPGQVGGPERGGQVIERADGSTYIRVGPEAGRPTEARPGSNGEWEHKPAPKGERTIFRSHTHTRGGGGSVGTRGAGGANQRQQVNTPGSYRGRQDGIYSDIGIVLETGVPVQTIGPNVTTTAYVVKGVPHLAIDAGDRNALDLKGLARDGVVVDP